MEGQISKKIIENVLINKDSLKSVSIDDNLINNLDNNLNGSIDVIVDDNEIELSDMENND